MKFPYSFHIERPPIIIQLHDLECHFASTLFYRSYCLKPCAPEMGKEEWVYETLRILKEIYSICSVNESVIMFSTKQSQSFLVNFYLTLHYMNFDVEKTNQVMQTLFGYASVLFNTDIKTYILPLIVNKRLDYEE